MNKLWQMSSNDSQPSAQQLDQEQKGHEEFLENSKFLSSLLLGVKDIVTRRKWWIEMISHIKIDSKE